MNVGVYLRVKHLWGGTTQRALLAKTEKAVSGPLAVLVKLPKIGNEIVLFCPHYSTFTSSKKSSVRTFILTKNVFFPFPFLKTVL
jgi:hypothetical protein